MGPASSKARAYDNARREQQASENRQRIVDAAMELLSDKSFGIPAIAARAGVSVPTVYRNFAGREALLRAVNEAIVQRLGGPPSPRSSREVIAGVGEAHAAFTRNEKLIRAQHASGLLREVVAHGRGERDARWSEALADQLAHLPKAEARAVTGVLRIISGADAWLTLLDRFGLTPRVATRVVTWAIRTLIETLEEEREAGARSLGGVN